VAHGPIFEQPPVPRREDLGWCLVRNDVAFKRDGEDSLLKLTRLTFDMGNLHNQWKHRSRVKIQKAECFPRRFAF